MMGHPSLFPVLEGRAGHLDLVIEQGATWDDELEWLTRDDPAQPLDQAIPVDLTGCSAVLVATAAGQEVLRLTSAAGGIVLGGSTGIINLRMTSAETAALAFQAAVYRLDVTLSDGSVRRLLAGTINLERQP